MENNIIVYTSLTNFTTKNKNVKIYPYSVINESLKEWVDEKSI